MTTKRHAVVSSPGVCGGKLWGKPTQDKQSSQVHQEMQGRFPAPDTGLGTKYPISFSHPQPPWRTRGRGGDHMVFLYSKYLHLALMAPLLNLSAGGFYVFSFSVQIWPIGSVFWSLLWTLTSLKISAFSFSSDTSFPVLCVCGCVCVSLRGFDWKPQLWSGLWSGTDSLTCKA